mmetsp:Transcript_17336/g.45554  ORF Transcript_17336/g.45554 Transcript_17336/m.45554 type:complete len:89 (-) Transcript_17336:422-688(-)
MSASRASWTQRSDSASSADVASSKHKTAGSLQSALAIATLCFWPPLSAAPRSPTSVSAFSGSSSTKDAAFAARRHAATFSSEGGFRRP